ncbi:taste receptor type 2 member 9-like [Mantella aurantiaca]
MINASILAMYFIHWKSIRNSIVYDRILLSIVLMNISLQICLTVDGVLDTLETFVVLGKNTFLIMFTLQFAFFYASAWNTAWLSVFYYSRLVSFSHPYLLRMKAMFLSSVPQLMVGSVLSSVVINLPFFWLTEANAVQNRTLTTPMSGYNVAIHPGFTVFNSLVGFVLPLAVTCLCIGQCVTSLLRHVWRMNLSESHLTSSQLQGHIRAAGTMIMRLLLDLTFYLIVIIGVLKSFRLPVIYSICSWISNLTYPTAQSLILIHGNPKLKSKVFGRCTSD